MRNTILEQTKSRRRMKALIVDDELRSDTAFGRASRDLVTELRAREVEVAEAASAEDGL